MRLGGFQLCGSSSSIRDAGCVRLHADEDVGGVVERVHSVRVAGRDERVEPGEVLAPLRAGVDRYHLRPVEDWGKLLGDVAAVNRRTRPRALLRSGESVLSARALERRERNIVCRDGLSPSGVYRGLDRIARKRIQAADRCVESLLVDRVTEPGARKLNHERHGVRHGGPQGQGPDAKNLAQDLARKTRGVPPHGRNPSEELERETGFEPATLSLGS